jgi:hypothetical protein
MPWSAKDAAGKTKKAKRSPAAGRQWASTANAVLAKTGDDGRAIRIANAAVAKRKKRRT